MYQVIKGSNCPPFILKVLYLVLNYLYKTQTQKKKIFNKTKNRLILPPLVFEKIVVLLILPTLVRKKT